MELIHNYGFMLVMITAIFGFIMAFGIGANDVANAMGTSVGSGVISVKSAIYIALVFEFMGAYLAGGEVAETIKSGIIASEAFAGKPDVLILGMMASLFSAGTWLLVASKMGWPVSTTHSIIGAIVGFACITVGMEAVQWSEFGGIVGSWFITPPIAGFVAYIIFISTQKLIFDTEKPLENARKYAPYYTALTVFIICVVTLDKGLKHVGLNLSGKETALLGLIVAIISAIICIFYLRSKSFLSRLGDGFEGVEKVFTILMIITACAMAFAHGSNDVANAIGPVAGVVSIVDHGGIIEGKTIMAPWILPMGAIGIALGLAIMGHKVMGTIGTGITDLTPSRGFAAQFACAITVVLASGTGLPISTTQTLVGAVLGVGFARGIAALNLGVIRNIVASWVITLPAGAILSIAIYYILNAIFC
ncbi:inorganic phosphate transporter [Muribacter muris]|uniref:Phosphate transporter n=1 Tax=Muribacter muris TaxID=67855 RepID=A0A4Y9K639_9PAST|nr:inorganic phosphate transporter [Muribacter muris]MBF0784413.1 inorganic phosphate transporter [Muribacter muris]MBF0827959.1 inorganic phosphate transporter [Muribacter muris]TFV12187.1 inorganic phosphate transporter [Muribacter muris]